MWYSARSEKQSKLYQIYEQKNDETYLISLALATLCNLNDLKFKIFFLLKKHIIRCVLQKLCTLNLLWSHQYCLPWRLKICKYNDFVFEKRLLKQYFVHLIKIWWVSRRFPVGIYFKKALENNSYEDLLFLLWWEWGQWCKKS